MDGEITWPPPAPKLSAAPPKKPAQRACSRKAEAGTAVLRRAGHRYGRRCGLALLGLGAVAPAEFMGHFTVFVLACFVGYMVIWNVKPALHTPLMSVTNAISSIIVIGALLQISSLERADQVDRRRARC